MYQLLSTSGEYSEELSSQSDNSLLRLAKLVRKLMYISVQKMSCDTSKAVAIFFLESCINRVPHFEKLNSLSFP